MWPSNSEPGARRAWSLDRTGRWTLNPAVSQVTSEKKMLLKNMKKIDEAWEFFGLEIIRQFYYFIGDSDRGDKVVLRFHEDAFSVRGPDYEEIQNVLEKIGLNENTDLTSSLQKYRKLLLPPKVLTTNQMLQKATSTREFIQIPAKPQFNVSRLKTGLCYLTLTYFSQSLENKCRPRKLDVVRQTPVNHLSRLPAELRLQILAQMSIAEADRALRSSFQDLVHLYLPTLQLKAKQRLVSLFSRENYVYAGTVYDEPEIRNSLPCDVYRLRYPNLHPELQPRKYHPNHERHAPDLHWDAVQFPPSLSQAGLLLMDACEQILWHKNQYLGRIIRHRDKIWRTNARPRPLSFYIEPDIYEERDEPTVSIREQENLHHDMQLLIYQDELNLILDELEPFLRPAFLKHYTTSLCHGSIDSEEDFAYIFPSPELDKIVPLRPTHEYEYGCGHLMAGTRISRDLWDVTTTKGIEHTELTPEEWRKWLELDKERQEAEKEQEAKVMEGEIKEEDKQEVKETKRKEETIEEDKREVAETEQSIPTVEKDE